MIKKIAIVLLVIGALGLIYFGIDAYQQSETFSVVGIDVAVSKANWNPVIFSGVIAAVGLLMWIFSRKR